MRFEPLDFEFQWRRAHPFKWGRNGVMRSTVCHFGTSEHKTTETKENAPWAPQQPYLTGGFGAAQSLLDSPAPQQQNTVAGLTPQQLQAIMGISGLASNGSPIASAGTGFGSNLLSGDYFGSNPGSGYFSSLAGSNLGLNGPGSATLSSFANGGGAGSGTLNAFANGGGVGSDVLSKFANGGYFSNGYSDDTAKSIMAQVIPQVASSFNKGNSINNPQAARSAAEGVTSALAPIEYQNYQTQEQLAQNAASTLRSGALTGATQLGANALTGASGANSSAIAGGNLQAAGAQGLSSSYQDTLAKMVQGLALAPSTQGLNYADMQQLLNAGGLLQGQAQKEASAGDASYNFSQMSPYQQLQAYMQAVTGSYGGTSTDTKPYYTNDTANTLGTVSGIASTAAMFLPFL